MKDVSLSSIGTLVSAYGRQCTGDVVLVCGDATRTWAQIDSASTRIARSLMMRGVTFGDLVSIALPNGNAMIETCFAIWKLGATPQPMPHRATVAEVARIVALARPPLIVADRAESDIAGAPVVAPDALLASSTDEAVLPEVTAPSFKAPLSGGSTGQPKLIVSTSQGVVDPAMLALWRLRPGEIAVMPGPLSHNAPFLSAFLALLGGGKLILLPRFDPESVLTMVERHRATWLYLVPTMMHRISRLPDAIRLRYDVSSLETVWHMAAPCAPWLKHSWIDWVGADVIWELYAGTEAQAIAVINGSEWLAHPGSVGRVVSGDMRILCPDKRDVPVGTLGEIFMQPANGQPTYRYVGSEAEHLGGWETLGDIVWFDADGYLYLADRRSDMILVGGANIYPAEIEQALETHPDVISAAVIGLPDEDYGQRLHAILHMDRPIEVGALAAHLAVLLAPQKRPRTFEFVANDLRDAAGKIRRSALREARI